MFIPTCITLLSFKTGFQSHGSEFRRCHWVVRIFPWHLEERFCTRSFCVSAFTQIRCCHVSWNVIFLFIWGLGLKRWGLALRKRSDIQNTLGLFLQSLVWWTCLCMHSVNSVTRGLQRQGTRGQPPSIPKAKGLELFWVLFLRGNRKFCMCQLPESNVQKENNPFAGKGD